MIRRSTALFFLLCALILPTVSAADDPYWMILEKGKRLFNEKLYGDALLQFEDALRKRRSVFEQSERALIDVLSRPDVRVLADDLSAVENHIDSHNLLAARAALDILYKTVDVSALTNSVEKTLKKLKALKAYPEAEYWKGEVFRIEGESSIALSQYERALSAQDQLEIPEEALTIRYRIAALRASRREYVEMEKQLVAIIMSDPLWSDQKESFVRDAMARTLIHDGLDRFLALYRHSSPMTYKAHRDLGLYYYRTGRHDRAYSQLIFAFLNSSTTILEELRSADQEFVFTTFSAVLDTARSPRNNAGNYIQSSEYFKTLYYLAASLYANGHRNTALELWRIIAARQEAGEWKGRSGKQLASPFVESSTETP